jgi:hypothetical protein
MLNWIDLASYGIPGLLIAGSVYVIARLIERGFTFRVPPGRR